MLGPDLARLWEPDRPVMRCDRSYGWCADGLCLPVAFFFFFFFFFWVTGEMSIPFRQAAVKDARRT
ncbi:hypothetical protein ABBQ32_007245 [Trebouxia sp. C0010 RCD-2024]